MITAPKMLRYSPMSIRVRRAWPTMHLLITAENSGPVSTALGEYAHTNGIESFWAVLKRAYHGTYHHLSKKHLNRYVTQFAGKHNLRELDTMDQMASVIKGMVGKRIKYKDLVA